jgi:hypothetical protein
VLEFDITYNIPSQGEGVKRDFLKSSILAIGNVKSSLLRKFCCISRWLFFYPSVCKGFRSIIIYIRVHEVQLGLG